MATAGTGAFSGTGNVLLPMLIAAAIVLNTMLGSVYERQGEIATYSAVGLSPVHVATLFLAGSLVYATIGAVLGYLAGQGAAMAITKLGLLKLTLNYSSLATVTSTMIVMAVVVLSTIYPAVKASRLATASGTATWAPPAPAGDVLDTTLPFTVRPRLPRADCVESLNVCTADRDLRFGSLDPRHRHCANFGRFRLVVKGSPVRIRPLPAHWRRPAPAPIVQSHRPCRPAAVAAPPFVMRIASMSHLRKPRTARSDTR